MLNGLNKWFNIFDVEVGILCDKSLPLGDQKKTGVALNKGFVRKKGPKVAIIWEKKKLNSSYLTIDSYMSLVYSEVWKQFYLSLYIKPLVDDFL